MNLPSNYYHCFMGNGLDAVLIGYSGSMVPDKVGADRCAWYKADRYYPEHKLVQVAGRFPVDRPLEHAQGSGWYEIAPLGRTWYEAYLDGHKLEIQSTRQEFVPREGTLYTDLDFGPARARVTTFLHAARSLLIERCEFDHDVELRAWIAPGVWVEDAWDTDPFERVEMDAGAASGSYDLGETHGSFHLSLDPAPSRVLENGLERGLAAEGKTFTKIFSILDNRQEGMDAAAFQALIAPGCAALREEHLAFWREYFSASRVTLPDEQFQLAYEAAQYGFKAAQNRETGGLPVNNLRRTWSSHVFWDSHFIHRALLEANHMPEALEGCRFFERTLDHARRHARDEFGLPGLKWDWEITHDGRKAYGTLLHMKFQMHNNGSYAHELWQYYRFTRDRDYLARFYPILEGLATFFLSGLAQKTERGWEIPAVVGVHESPEKVKNEGTTLAATIAILEHCADAAHELGRENEFTARCREVAAGLRETLGSLFNGRAFVAAEGTDILNMSSMSLMFPMEVISCRDPRGVSTTQALLAYDRERSWDNKHRHYSPWGSGVFATILARQGNAPAAWQILQETRKAICSFGGMTEVIVDGEWNMQYFLTAQAAVACALHGLLLEEKDGVITLFPAVPQEWQRCSFERLRARPLEVSAQLQPGEVHGQVRNASQAPFHGTLCWKEHAVMLELGPGESYAFDWSE